MAFALYTFPPSWLVVVAISIGLTGVLALAVARYEAAVTLGFLLFAVVKIEPAPTDGIFTVAIAVAAVTGRFDIRRVPFSVGGFLGAFLAVTVLSAVEVIDVAAAARFMTITLYLAVFTIWFTWYLDSEHRARSVVRAYVGSATAFALVASAALFLPVPGGDLLLRYDGTRAAGLFEDPNVFGPFLIPAALIVLEELLQPRLMRSGRLPKVMMFLALSGGVLFSYSRAAWVSYVAGVLVLLVVLALRRGGGRRALVVLLVLMLAGVAAIGVIAVTGSLGFLQERAHFQSYDVERFGAQREGIQLAEQYPFGIGPGQFDVLVTVSTHSTYVRTLSEQGILGLATIVGLVSSALVLAGRNAILGHDTFGIGSAALLAAWVGILINSFVVDTLHWRHLWFVLGLICVGAMRAAGPASDRSGPTPTPPV